MFKGAVMPRDDGVPEDTDEEDIDEENEVEASNEDVESDGGSSDGEATDKEAMNPKPTYNKAALAEDNLTDAQVYEHHLARREQRAASCLEPAGEGRCFR